MQWKLQKDMDVGTSNPIVARLTVGLFEIIDFSILPEDKKEKLKSNCYDIMKLLVSAEKSAKPIIGEIQKIIEDIKANGIETQSNGRCINVPSATSIDGSRTFIKYAKQVLQEVAQNINIIFDKKYDGPHFHKIRDDFISEFGNDFIVTKLLIEDQAWIKNIIDLRNEDEHPKTGKDYCNNFDITRDSNGRFVVIMPTFFNGTQIANALEIYTYNLLTFAEEITVYSLEKFFPEIATIYEIPENERRPELPTRFRIGLKTKISTTK